MNNPKYSVADIFEAITPENIKNIPVLKEAMEIFIEAIEEKCSISQDIRNIFKSDNKIIRDELIKIYMDDFHRYFTKAQSDEVITRAIDKHNIYHSNKLDRNFLNDLQSIFNDEYFITQKSFKQKKGTKVAIEYVYNLVESLLTDSTTSSFNFVPGEVPFDFRIEGTLLSEIYDRVVKPISHPLGFTYIYLQLLSLSLEDEYGITYEKENISIEVRCLSGNIDVYNGNDVIDIITNNDNNEYSVIVYFEDGSYLVQTDNPIQVIYYDHDNNIIKDYSSDHCSIYLNYDTVIKYWTEDTEFGFEVTKGLNDYWWEKGNSRLILIGTFYVGEENVIIGKPDYYNELDEVDFEVTMDTQYNQYYTTFDESLSFQVGTTVIGTSGDGELIGYGVINELITTSDIYNILSEVNDTDFLIEII